MKLRLSLTCFFLFLLLVALALMQEVASASPPNDDGHEVRRYLKEEEEAECILYLILGTEDHDSERWICRFTMQQAEELGIPAEMGVEGVPDDFFESAVSGGTLMKFRDGAFVKQASTSHKALGTLVVSRAGSAEVKAMSNDDPRHSGHRRTTGKFRTLVVRIIDSLNKEPPSVQTLRKEIFTDSLNMKTQYKACSHGQMTPEEAGIVDVKVNVPLTEDTDIYAFGRVAKAEAEAKYGGGGGLEQQYDLVMFVFPHGRGFGGYAPMFSFDSYYQSDWSLYPSVQMHEIGHSLGLRHSTKDGQEYGDRSSLMGNIGGKEGPHCFNPANNWQLRWYEKQQLSIVPWQLPGPQYFVLNGLDDYKPDGSSNGELVVLRLHYTGSEGNGWDYYVGYNRATGINSGVNAKPEFVDTLTVVHKIKGGMYGEGKTDRWNIPVGESYTIIRPGFPDVYIDFQTIQNGGKDAIVVIYSDMTGPNPNPTPYPTPSPTPYDSWPGTSSSTLNCEDDKDFRFKGKKNKNCKWVGKGKNKLNKKNIRKIKKKCRKKADGKKKVWDYCLETCALVDMGPCA